MKIIKFIILFLLNITVVFSQLSYVIQDGGTTENLTKVYFIDKSRGTIIGESGTILYTKNGGAKWEKKASGTNNTLNSISFVNSNNGFISGYGTTFLKTTDGGITWINLSDSIPSAFTSVSFCDSLNGFAIFRSDSINVLKTLDGGYHWEKVSTINYKYLTPLFIECLSPDVIIAGGGLIWDVITFKSLDGGITWKEKSGLYSDYLQLKKIQFISSNTGYILTNFTATGATGPLDTRFYKTIDAGDTWNDQEANVLRLESFFMVDENIGYAIGESQYREYRAHQIYKTVDNGINWQRQKLFEDETFTDLYFSDTENGTIIGRKGLILNITAVGITQDSTSDWIIQKGVTFKNLTGVAFLNNSTAFATGLNGTLLKTNNSGVSWAEANSGTESDLFDISFPSDTAGFMLGYDSSTEGEFFFSNDMGDTWNIQSNFADYKYRISFINEKDGLIAGIGYVLKTNDGGENWLFNASNPTSFIIDAVLINKDIGYAVGTNILSTSDGGLSWQVLDNGIQSVTYGYVFRGLEFLDKNVGYAVGSNGIIIKTIDGCSYWSVQKSGTTNQLNDIIFTDRDNGIIVGNSGTILTTINGGLEWEKELVSTMDNLKRIAIRDSIVLCVGDLGTIIRYDKWPITSAIDTNSIDTTKVEPDLPDNYSLFQNYPNPFNPSTTIEYSIPTQTHVALKIYDILGREVFTLVNEEKVAGNYSLKFDGSNLSSGVYFYRLTAGQFNQTKKLVFMR